MSQRISGRKLLVVVMVVLLVIVISISGMFGAMASPPDVDGNDLPPRTVDDLFSELGSRIPEFAGVTVRPENNEGGLTTLIIATTRSDPRVSSAIWDQLPIVVGHTFGAARFESRTVQYSFRTLKNWYESVRARIWAVPGVVFTDIDEAKNKLAIGVENPSVQEPQVQTILDEARIPSDAVVISKAEPEVPAASLQDYHRPVVGGLQIEYYDYSDGEVYWCTLGFVAVRQGVQGFVTNSHCSSTQGSVEGTSYDQPTFVASGLLEIGWETVDNPLLPYPTLGGCYSGKVCRYTDANFSRRGCSFLTCDSSVRLGFIARPNVGIAWDGISTYRVVNTGTPAVGDFVWKVGRTTGATNGTVTSSCADVGVGGTNIVMLCQGRAPYGAQDGDSGAPVFRTINSPNLYDVRLGGINWGSTTFSPISNFEIAGELPGLSVCAPDPNWNC